MQAVHDLYFVAIIPPKSVEKKITGIKHEFADRFSSDHALRSPPHITLNMPFKWRPDHEKKLIQCLETVTLENPIKITLNNFNCFPPRVIYIDVEESDDLYNLWACVTYTLRKNLGIDNADYKNRGFLPHVTVAFRDLKKPAFTSAWDEFKDRKYNAQFDVNSIWLLKHNGKVWERYHEFIVI